MAGLLQRVAQPFEALVQAIPCGCNRRLDELEILSTTYEVHTNACGPTYPSTSSERVQTKLVSDLRGIHRILTSILVSR
jgi:hypothetical protein